LSENGPGADVNGVLSKGYKQWEVVGAGQVFFFSGKTRKIGTSG
jgi:hypothetical protein